ncbi:puff II/9-2 protein-like [Tiliqua scincoides]|uniref:puff II/9-2 protein-like n=1 Tax=Tiliqua scincoides TaxID=71010 RepID=UPI003462BD78
MRQQFLYRLLSQSSEDNTEEEQRSICRRWALTVWSCKWSLRAKILFALITVSLLLHSSFWAIYFWQEHSKLSVRWTKCQKQLQNQTTQVQDTVKSLKICTETLKNGSNQAKKGSDDLRVQLELANQSLHKTHQHWDTCQKELNTWNNSIRIQTKQQEAVKHKLQECQAQLQNQTAQMLAQKKITEALKKDLEKAKKDGDDLHAQLVTANQNFDKTQQLWDSCQKELNTLHDSVRIQTKQQEAEKLKFQEQIRSLQQHLQDQSQKISKMENEMKLELPKSSEAIIHVLGIILFLTPFALLLL